MNDLAEAVEEEVIEPVEEVVEEIVEEVVDETPNEPIEEAPVEAPEMDADEIEARSHGWVPLDEWKGDPGLWSGYKAFNRVGENIKQRSKQNKYIEELKSDVDALTERQETIRARTIKELNEKRREAIQEADVDRVEEIEGEIKELEEVKPQEEPKAPVINPDDKVAIDGWFEKNKWFDDLDDPRTPFMQAQQKRNIDSGMSIAEALEASDKAVRKEFAHKFENPRKTEPAVVSDAGRVKKKTTVRMSDLTDADQRIFRQLNQKFGTKLEDFYQEMQGNS